MPYVLVVLLVCLISAGSPRAAMAQDSDKKTDDLKPADPDTGESTVEESTLGLLPYPFEKRGVSPCSQPSSTAMRLVPAQKTRNCVTGTVSISASTIRRWC